MEESSSLGSPGSRHLQSLWSSPRQQYPLGGEPTCTEVILVLLVMQELGASPAVLARCRAYDDTARQSLTWVLLILHLTSSAA